MKFNDFVFVVLDQSKVVFRNKWIVEIMLLIITFVRIENVSARINQLFDLSKPNQWIIDNHESVD